ncbi:MAG: orotidine-5'-phosphate decarboxylase [Acidobacteria bacterium]|nr:MAG: orotidine-5'-phosphate decarboxylase [Acidobacteriota bacterium]
MTRDRHPGAERLAVALDVPDREAAAALARTVAPYAAVLKIGLELFVAEGPGIVADVAAHGAAPFLDLKLHDIPRTVAAATRRAAALGVRYLTLHALGGPAMIRAAREAVDAGGAVGRPELLAVTVLTSHGREDLEAIGLPGRPADHVLRLARMALDAGADGIVCSPLECCVLREALGDGPTIVTPGVRPLGGERGDQRRVATPAEAVAAGSSLLVVGRPIVAAPDPAAAARAICEEIAAS